MVQLKGPFKGKESDVVIEMLIVIRRTHDKVSVPLNRSPYSEYLHMMLGLGFTRSNRDEDNKKRE